MPAPNPNPTWGRRGLVEQMGKSKEHKKTAIKPFMVKNYLSVFVNCMIENPAFDSQVHRSPYLLSVNKHPSNVRERPDSTPMLRNNKACNDAAIKPLILDP